MATFVTDVAASQGLPGGASAVLDVTAPTVIKNDLGVLCQILVTTPGTGALTINDNNALGSTNTTANQIVSFASVTAGQIITLNWPCGTGITLSSVPSGGLLSVSYS